MSELPSQFSPSEIEGPLYQKWLDAGYFTADSQSTKQPFSIVIPPPNVTGSLHIGHALDHTIQDLLTRMKRMKGFETLWLPGMDHAGIATQNVVEKQLAAQGKSRHDLGREEFVKKVWSWKAESGGAILGQMKRLGDSVDWSRERFTMDEGLSEAVLTIFKRLYDSGLIYRAEKIINWCPRCLTALSDIEVDHSDDAGEFVQVRYGDDELSITVATTRPETMLGDGAVAVHPNDERYKHMIGKSVLLPLVNRMIPIIADELVEPEFGTGAVKVTAAHDPNDFEMGMRHNVPLIVIMNEHGVPLGTRTPLGITSFRKTVLALDGAYLHWSGDCQLDYSALHPPLKLRSEPIPLAFRLRKLTSWLDCRTHLPIRPLAQTLIRYGRRSIRRPAIAENPAEEFQLPHLRAIHASSLAIMNQVDRTEEILRRRTLFKTVGELAAEHNVKPVFTNLPSGVSPQGFAYYSSSGNVRRFHRQIQRQRLGEAMSWPSLPRHTCITPESRLLTLKIVNFVQ